MEKNNNKSKDRLIVVKLIKLLLFGICALILKSVI